MRRAGVASTSIRRHFDVICLPGVYGKRYSVIETVIEIAVTSPEENQKYLGSKDGTYRPLLPDRFGWKKTGRPYQYISKVNMGLQGDTCCMTRMTHVSCSNVSCSMSPCKHKKERIFHEKNTLHAICLIAYDNTLTFSSKTAELKLCIRKETNSLESLA